MPDVRVPFDADHPTSGHIMPVVLPQGCDRAAVAAAMRAAAVQTSVHYPPIHAFSYYRERFDGVRLPHTEHFARHELTLPLHPGLGHDDIARTWISRTGPSWS